MSGPFGGIVVKARQVQISPDVFISIFMPFEELREMLLISNSLKVFSGRLLANMLDDKSKTVNSFISGANFTVF